MCPDYVPKEKRYRIRQRILDKKPPTSRNSKPSLALLLSKERSVVRPSVIRSVDAAELFAAFPQKTTQVKIGGNGAFVAPPLLLSSSQNDMTAKKAIGEGGGNPNLRSTTPEEI
jgi:hypothetical protein